MIRGAARLVGTVGGWTLGALERHMAATQFFKKDDPKLGTIMSQGSDGQVVVIGFPYGDGCLRNGGRPGSHLGPSCLRRFLPFIGPIVNCEMDISLEQTRISDYGDVTADNFDAAHERLVEAVRSVLFQPQHPVAVVVGGGSDICFSSAKAFLSLCETTGSRPVIITVDAHLDVRTRDDAGLPHSGSPFRQVMEESDFHRLNGRFQEFGSQGSQCCKAHVDYVKQHGGQIQWLSSIRRIQRVEAPGAPVEVLTQAGAAFWAFLSSLAVNERLYLCFNLDSINSAFCPGVSCPSVVGGFTAEEAIEIGLLAGCCDKVQMMDINEFNPGIEDFRTGRLVANIVYHLILGSTKRQKAS